MKWFGGGARPSVELCRLDDAGAETLSLSTVETLWLPILELPHLRLVLLDELLVRVSLLNTRVLIFLLALAGDTFSCHDVSVDVARDVLVHALELLELGGLELLLCSKLLCCFLLAASRLFLAFLLNSRQFIFIDLFTFRLLNELLETLGELGACGVPLSRLDCRVLALLASAPDDALDRSKVVVQGLQLVLHLLEVAVLQSFLLLLGHRDSAEGVELLAFEGIGETGSFSLLSDATHEHFLRCVSHLPLELFD